MTNWENLEKREPELARYFRERDEMLDDALGELIRLRKQNRNMREWVIRTLDKVWFKEVIDEARYSEPEVGIFGAKNDKELAESLAIAVKDTLKTEWKYNEN